MITNIPTADDGTEVTHGKLRDDQRVLQSREVSQRKRWLLRKVRVNRTQRVSRLELGHA